MSFLSEQEIADIQEEVLIKAWKKEQRKHRSRAEYQVHLDSKKQCNNVETVKKVPPWSITLGVNYPCTWREVRQAYFDKVKKTHPDHGGSTSDLMRVREAYEQASLEFPRTK